jgi:hypothetical protein
MVCRIHSHQLQKPVDGPLLCKRALVVERTTLAGRGAGQFTVLIGVALRSDGRQPLNAAIGPGRASKGVYIGSPTGRIRKLMNWEVRGGLDSGNGPSWEAEHIT